MHKRIIFNRLVTFNLCQLAYILCVYLYLGMRVTLFHLVYSLVSVLLYESINYIEHYGLTRKKINGE